MYNEMEKKYSKLIFLSLLNSQCIVSKQFALRSIVVCRFYLIYPAPNGDDRMAKLHTPVLFGIKFVGMRPQNR